MKLLLYGTRFCHLCEQAEAVLHAARLTAEYIDITEDKALLEKYGMRIPVVQRVDNGAEFGWPFDASALERLVA
ncbi:MAG TPA: glutaredoxin family protein [Gallionella sp.]